MDIDKAPHFCQDGHEPIRYWNSEQERCPMCRLLDKLEAAQDDAYGLSIELADLKP